jgi:hypothetical protein
MFSCSCSCSCSIFCGHIQYDDSWGKEKRHALTAGVLLEHGACLAEDGSWGGGCDHPSSMTQYHHTYDILDEYFQKRGGSTPVDEL